MKERKKMVWPKGWCVYFLIEDGEIVYIGKSDNILKRVGEHAYRKSFDSIEFIECESATDAYVLEANKIIELQPRDNKKLDNAHLVGLATPCEIEDLAVEMGKSRWYGTKKMVENQSLKKEVCGRSYYNRDILKLL